MVLTWVPPVIVRICEWTLAVVVVLFLAVPTANAQCETTGQCFCDAGTMERGPGVSIDQLIRGVRIALGEAECPGASLTPTPTDAATGTPTATATTGPAVLQPGVTIHGALSAESQIDVYIFSVEQPMQAIFQLQFGRNTHNIGCLEIRPAVPGGQGCEEGLSGGILRLDVTLPADSYSLIVTTQRFTWAYDLSYQLLPPTAPVCDLCPCPTQQ